MTKSKPETVRLYPVEGVAAYPWPAVEFDATPEQAAELLAYVPAPFTTERPGGPVTAAKAVIGDQGDEVDAPI